MLESLLKIGIGLLALLLSLSVLIGMMWAFINYYNYIFIVFIIGMILASLFRFSYDIGEALLEDWRKRH